jgi:hypothetical protein
MEILCQGLWSRPQCRKLFNKMHISKRKKYICVDQMLTPTTMFWGWRVIFCNGVNRVVFPGISTISTRKCVSKQEIFCRARSILGTIFPCSLHNLELPMQSMPITTDVGSTPTQGSSLRVPACLQTHLYKEKMM